MSPVKNGYFVKVKGNGSHVLCKIYGEASYSVLFQTSGYDSFGIVNNGIIPVCKENENIIILDEQGKIMRLQ